MADRLVLLIPGYQYTFKKNATLDELKAELSAMVGELRPTAGSIAASTRGGLTGYQVSVNGRTTELYEISWQDRVVLLNQKKLYERIWGGFISSGSWILNPGVLRALRRNRVWLMWFLISAVLMFFWFYGIAAVAFVAAGNFHFQALPLPASAALYANLAVWQKTFVSIGIGMQSWWFWVGLTAALAAAGVRPDFVADLADLMRRYLSDAKDDDPAGLYTLAERFRQVVYDSIATLPAGGAEEILIVGHSFGTLLAIDAIASGVPTMVSLMTLGALLPFLTASAPLLQQTVDKCGNSPQLVRWDDYFSGEDWFGNSTPLKTTSGLYNPHPVNMNVSFLKRFTLAAHHGYYRDLDILKSMVAGAP